MEKKRNDYISIETYPDGSQFIMALSDIPKEEIPRNEDYLFEKSIMDPDMEVVWRMPTAKEFELLVKLHKENVIDLNVLNFQPHCIYEADSIDYVFDYDSLSLIYGYYCSGKIDDNKGYAMRAVAIARPKQEEPDAPMTLKRFVLQYGPVRYDYLKLSLPHILSQLDNMHEEGLCHNDICPDTITIDDSCHFILQESSYKAAPSKGKAVLSEDGFHKCFWAPENYIGETSFYSDQYQLAMTIYFAIHGQLPPDYKKCDGSDIRGDFKSRDFLPNDFEQNAFERCLVRALRLNPTERFPCMDIWSKYVLDEIVEFNAYSDYFEYENTMNPSGFLHIIGNRHQTYLNFLGAKTCRHDKRVLEAYKTMGIRLEECFAFRCYQRHSDTSDNHTYVYFPNGRCKNLFRLMVVSMAVREFGEDRYLDEYCDDAWRAVNEINKTHGNVRGFCIKDNFFLSYEKLMAGVDDYEKMINDAHQVIWDTEATLKRLLDGGTLEEGDKPDDWVSVPVFYLNERNISHLLDEVHQVNVASPFARCVVRGETVCLEGPKKHIDEGIGIFELIKNYSYQY